MGWSLVGMGSGQRDNEKPGFGKEEIVTATIA
jgi:hypothetical protein